MNLDQTHFRAALVGLLNTLIVAFLGCILATVVGVIAGVLRLSHNWLTAKIMGFYVEKEGGGHGELSLQGVRDVIGDLA